MERNVFISIRGMHQLQDNEGREEDVEVVSRGQYYKRNGKEYISYEEQLGPDGERSKATIKVDGDCVLVNHMGAIGAQMRFELGKRNLIIYQTPFGVMEMGITTRSMDLDLQEHSWQIRIGYTLDLDNHYSGEHEVYIAVQDSKAEPVIRLVE